MLEYSFSLPSPLQKESFILQYNLWEQPSHWGLYLSEDSQTLEKRFILVLIKLEKRGWGNQLPLPVRLQNHTTAEWKITYSWDAQMLSPTSQHCSPSYLHLSMPSAHKALCRHSGTERKWGQMICPQETQHREVRNEWSRFSNTLILVRGGVIRQRVSPKDKWLQWGSPGGGSQWETVQRTLKGNLGRVGIYFTSFMTLLWASWHGRITDRSNLGDNRKRKKDFFKIHS